MTESNSELVSMEPDIYRGYKPSFVREIWAKRRAERGEPPAKAIHLPNPITKTQRKWTAPDKAKVVQMMNEGLTREEIARRMGRTKDSVEAFVKRLRRASERMPVEESK